MSILCKDHNHTWTLDTDCGIITPPLDLVPGRCCHCRDYVIVPHPTQPDRSGCYAIASIHSIEAAAMVERHPVLKTW